MATTPIIDDAADLDRQTEAASGGQTQPPSDKNIEMGAFEAGGQWRAIYEISADGPKKTAGWRIHEGSKVVIYGSKLGIYNRVNLYVKGHPYPQSPVTSEVDSTGDVGILKFEVSNKILNENPQDSSEIVLELVDADHSDNNRYLKAHFKYAKAEKQQGAEEKNSQDGSGGSGGTGSGRQGALSSGAARASGSRLSEVIGAPVAGVAGAMAAGFRAGSSAVSGPRPLTGPATSKPKQPSEEELDGDDAETSQPSQTESDDSRPVPTSTLESSSAGGQTISQSGTAELNQNVAGPAQTSTLEAGANYSSYGSTSEVGGGSATISRGGTVELSQPVQGSAQSSTQEVGADISVQSSTSQATGGSATISQTSTAQTSAAQSAGTVQASVQAEGASSGGQGEIEQSIETQIAGARASASPGGASASVEGTAVSGGTAQIAAEIKQTTETKSASLPSAEISVQTPASAGGVGETIAKISTAKTGVPQASTSGTAGADIRFGGTTSGGLGGISGKITSTGLGSMPKPSALNELGYAARQAARAMSGTNEAQVSQGNEAPEQTQEEVQAQGGEQVSGAGIGQAPLAAMPGLQPLPEELQPLGNEQEPQASIETPVEAEAVSNEPGAKSPIIPLMPLPDSSGIPKVPSVPTNGRIDGIQGPSRKTAQNDADRDGISSGARQAPSRPGGNLDLSEALPPGVAKYLPIIQKLKNTDMAAQGPLGKADKALQLGKELAGAAGNDGLVNNLDKAQQVGTELKNLGANLKADDDIKMSEEEAEEVRAASDFDPQQQENFSRNLRRVRRVLKTTKKIADITGYDDLGEAADELNELAGGGAGRGSGGPNDGAFLGNRLSSKLQNLENSKLANKAANKMGVAAPSNLSRGAATAAGGALEAALAGEKPLGIGQNALSWYVVDFAILSLITPWSPLALLYLDLHYIAAKRGSKWFRKPSYWQRTIIWVANLVYLIAIPLAFGAMVFYACNDIALSRVIGTVTGQGVSGTLKGFLFGESEICKPFEIKNFIANQINSFTSSQTASLGPLNTAKWDGSIVTYAQSDNIDACVLKVVVQKESNGQDQIIGCDCAKNGNPSACLSPDHTNYTPDYKFNWPVCSYGIGLTQWTIFQSTYASTPPSDTSNYFKRWRDPSTPSRTPDGKNFYTVQDFLNADTSLSLTAQTFLSSMKKADPSGPPYSRADIQTAFANYVGKSPQQAQLVADRMALYDACKANYSMPGPNPPNP